jgi:hypothetical protein
MSFVISAIENDYTASMRGYTYYRFVSFKDENGNYGPWVRVDKLPGVIILSHVQEGRNAAARHSSTDVEIEDLPEETILKTVAKGGHKTRVEILRNGEFTRENIKFIGNKRRGDNGWATVIELDGKRITI